MKFSKYTRFFSAVLIAVLLCGLLPAANVLAAAESPALSSLELIGAPLNERFSPQRSEYTADADAGTAEVSVRAGTDSGTVCVNDAKLEPGETSAPIPITSGDNLISIVLTSEDGASTRTVTIRVRKPTDYSEV